MPAQHSKSIKHQLDVGSESICAMEELEHDGDDKDEHEDYEAEEAAKASERL